jgi:hypothetical protein
MPGKTRAVAHAIAAVARILGLAGRQWRDRGCAFFPISAGHRRRAGSVGPGRAVDLSAKACKGAGGEIMGVGCGGGC